MAEGLRVSTREQRWPAIDRAVERARTLFPTITDGHWRAVFARPKRNDVAERIYAAARTGELGAAAQQKILAGDVGKAESEMTGKSATAVTPATEGSS